MKWLYVLLLLLPLLCHTYPLDDDSSEDSESAETDPQITKRSGGLDLVTHIKSGLLASISRASASLASGSSGGSSNYKSIDSGGQGNSVDFDPWSLKKSVLNTIFQAVKAITGGVTALKGQLIKGSGYVLSAGGRLVAASGDKVTDVGKNIINSAQLSPTPPQPHGQASNPIFKLSSLSGSSGGGGHSPVLHSETITTYEIPPGHHNYGPPPKPSSSHQQYLPPQSYSGGGGAPFASHASFEAPANNYLPSKYGPSYQDGGQHSDAFNIYGRNAKLSEKEVRKAAESLQEILQLLPAARNKNKEVTKTSVTIQKDHQQQQEQHDNGYSYAEPSTDFNQFDIPPLRQIESVSHVETITAAYGPPLPHKIQANPSDIYRQMANRNKESGSSPSISSLPPSGPSSSEGYSYPNPNYRDNSLNNPHSPPSPSSSGGGILKNANIVKSTSYQINIDPYRSSPPTSLLGPIHNNNHQPSAQQYTYFNPAQNKVDTQLLQRRRDLRQNIQKFQYLRDSQIRNAVKFNRNLLM